MIKIKNKKFHYDVTLIATPCIKYKDSIVKREI